MTSQDRGSRYQLARTMTMLASRISGHNDTPLPFPILLNHFYLVLDSVTYAAFEGDRFLREEFAVSEQRTTVRTDRTYTGLYFYGANTYFEFFDVAKDPGYRVGDSGIAFGVEQPGAVGSLENRMDVDPPTLVTRQLGNTQVPWFFMLKSLDLPVESGISTWIMEYHPRFLSEWHPEAEGSNAGIRRKQILQRYAATLNGLPAQPYLQDVVQITLATGKEVTSRLVEECKQFGYRSRTDGDTAVLEGPEITLRLAPETRSLRGIHQIELRVRGVPLRQTKFHFGPRSVLEFHGDGTATWSF
jgi:hypothetical protein